jgi:hypothetical protein
VLKIESAFADLINVFDTLVVELDHTLLGSYVALDGDDFSSIPGFLGGGVEFVGGSFDNIFSTTVDDDLTFS